MKISTPAIPPFDICPGFHARTFNTPTMTLAYVRVDAGATLPEHHHVHEQVTNLLVGEFEMTIGGETCTLRPGDAVAIPSNVPHSGRALADCYILDVFNPVRADFPKY